MTVALFIFAGFFAMNIGASGTAASMSAAYGGTNVSLRKCLILVGFFAFLGAAIGGHEVITTMSKGLVSEEVINLKAALIILVSASSILFFANMIGIPLSTSQVTVGALVGAGLFYQAVNLSKLYLILATWAVVPIAAYIISFFLFKLLYHRIINWLVKLGSVEKATKVLTIALVAVGSYEAFAAGMNNVANAVAPLVGAGVLTTKTGAFLGGIFLAIGAYTLGGRVLETGGKKITDLCLIQGIIVALTGGTLVVISSIYGIPMPLTQITTVAIMGVGCSKFGLKALNKLTVTKIFKVWLISPIVSLAATYLILSLL
jgi:sulfate permease